MIIATCHLSSRKEEDEEGQCCFCMEKAMKEPDERIDARYPTIYTISVTPYFS
jgi:hypothetical protein